jgi:hypothetical protein
MKDSVGNTSHFSEEKKKMNTKLPKVSGLLGRSKHKGGTKRRGEGQHQHTQKDEYTTLHYAGGITQ